jgi:hypothetical protein
MGTIDNIGYVLRNVIRPQNDQIGKPEAAPEQAAPRRVEDEILGPRARKPKPPGGSGGVPPKLDPLAPPNLVISPAFRLVVILVFVMVLLFGTATVVLAIFNEPSRPGIQPAYTIMSMLLTASVGAILGLIGGKAVV